MPDRPLTYNVRWAEFHINVDQITENRLHHICLNLPQIEYTYLYKITFILVLRFTQLHINSEPLITSILMFNEFF